MEHARKCHRRVQDASGSAGYKDALQVQDWTTQAPSSSANDSRDDRTQVAAPVTRTRLSKKTYIPLAMTANDVAKFASTVRVSFDNEVDAALPYEFPPVVITSISFIEGLELISIFIEYDSAHGGSALSKWPAYLTCAFPELGGLGLREMLARILAKCISNRMFGAAQYDSYEYWCGVGNITLEAVLLGANALRFDKLLASEHDCGFNNGLKLWILALTLSVAHSQQWYSPACGSFCFLCRSQSARSSQNDYAGDTSLSFVQDGNMQSDICSLMYFLSFLFGNLPLYETPLNGCMPASEPLKTVFTFTDSHRVTTWLGSFGAETCKPLQLWSPVLSVVDALRRDKPNRSGMTTLCVHRGPPGNRKFDGVKTALKASANYPREFGRTVAQVTQAYARDMCSR
jgi:hypothetical protein